MVFLKCIHQFWQKFNSRLLWLSALLFSLPVLGLADATKPDPFGLGGMKFGGNNNDAAKTFGSFTVEMLWWVGVVVIAICVITAITMILHILSMSKDDKEHHGVVGKWATVIICVVLALGLGGLLFTGLSAASGG